MQHRANWTALLALPFGLLPSLPKEPLVTARLPQTGVSPIVTAVVPLVTSQVAPLVQPEIRPGINQRTAQRKAANPKREGRQLAARWQEARRKETQDEWILSSVGLTLRRC